MGQTCSAYLRKGLQDGGGIDPDDGWYYEAAHLARPPQACRGQQHLLYKRNRNPPREEYCATTRSTTAAAETTTTTESMQHETDQSQQQQQQGQHDDDDESKQETMHHEVQQQQQSSGEGFVVLPESKARMGGVTVVRDENTTTMMEDGGMVRANHSHMMKKNQPEKRMRLVVRTMTPKDTTTTTHPEQQGAEQEPGNNSTARHQHVFCLRPVPPPTVDMECAQQQQNEKQRPTNTTSYPTRTLSCPPHMASLPPGQLYKPANMATAPSMEVPDWICVSPELHIYVCDTGLTHRDCDGLVAVTEHVCRGQYAAYTYAKQTLGCRDFPLLARACWDPVHRVCHAIQSRLVVVQNNNNKENAPQQKLQLDEREPHVVKYDVTKKERQKLDMHTDKSEWTFLIALSDGCGLDYEGGGTYFEALDATVHVQRGQALIFPGKLRHCGIRIRRGLRFLLVGFLVDKNAPAPAAQTPNADAAAAGNVKDDENDGNEATDENTA